MRIRRVFTLAIVLVWSSSFGNADAAPAGARASDAAYRSTLQRHIKHIVIVIQENRSVDNLFNGFPGADTVRVGMSRRGPVELRPVDLDYPADVDHQHHAFLQAFDGGRMDGWESVFTTPRQASTFPYAYVPENEVEPYWTMAERFTFADRTFESNSGPSFPAHLYLISGQGQYVASNPNHLETTHYAWGCDSPPDARVSLIGPSGDEVPGPWPCFDFETLADVALESGVTWRYYAPGLDSLGSIWSAYDAVRHIRFGPLWGNVVSPETRVLQDAKIGNLPSITWVVPSAQNSDHPFPRLDTEHDVGVSGQYGPQWVASIVNAIGEGPLWNSTAIVVVWDDWGGWYDHEFPFILGQPQGDYQYGFRVPLVVVSAYTPAGYINNTRHDFGSILRFIQHNFGIPQGSLNFADARSSTDLTAFFNLSAAPRTYQVIAAPKDANFFIHDKRKATDPDDQ